MDLDSAIFYTEDLKRAIEFYKEVVGLKLEYQQGKKYVSFIFDNGARLGIKTKEIEREKPGNQTIIITTPNVKLIHEKFISQGIQMFQDLTNESWGLTFSILDPDKNRLEFLSRN